MNGLPVNGTGYDFADYLLDLPYQTSVNRYLNGNDSFYYRESVGIGLCAGRFPLENQFLDHYRVCAGSTMDPTPKSTIAWRT